MKPYYQDDLVTLYHGDCLEITEWLSADVLVTDPPYGMAFAAGNCATGNGRNKAWTSRWTGVEIAGDGNLDARDLVLDLWQERPALVFGTWKMPPPQGAREMLVWDKAVSTGMGALDIPWRPSWEGIYVLGKGFVGARSHGVIRQALPTLAPERKMHPTPKPVPLMEHLIDKCPPGVVADPFAGSGATLVAASNQGRTSIGVELEERYCETIAKRLSNQTMTLDFGA